MLLVTPEKSLLDAVPAAGVSPNVDTYNTVISACAEEQHSERAIGLLDTVVTDKGR